MESAESHWRGESDEAKAFDKLRHDARAFLHLVLEDLVSFRARTGPYLVEAGYAELTKSYLYAAPLDALNWKVMKAPKYAGVHFKSWRDVVAMNIEAEDLPPLRFLQEYKRVTLETPENDPFPTADMDEIEIRLQIFNSKESDSVLEMSAAIARRMV